MTNSITVTPVDKFVELVCVGYQEEQFWTVLVNLIQLLVHFCPFDSLIHFDCEDLTGTVHLSNSLPAMPLVSLGQ